MNKSYSRISENRKSLQSSITTGLRKSTSKLKTSKQIKVQDHYIQLLYPKLSQAIIENPSCFEDNRISAVQRFINVIDIQPKKFQNIELLYLSNNNIRSINGIQQFTRLKSLSLAHNEIHDPNTVSYLQELPLLEALSLNGNPFCNIPNYRDYIISSIPTLKNLDGKNITAEDRQKCEINIRAQNNMFDIMTKNCCDLILMNSVIRKLDLHKEFLIKDPRFTWNLTDFSPSKLRQMYKLHEQFDLKQKGALRADIMNDINTIKQELSLSQEQNDIAFSELIILQEKKIAELALVAEQKWQSMNQLFKKNTLEHHYQSRQEGVFHVLSNRTSPKKSTRKMKNVLSPQASLLREGSSGLAATYHTSQQLASKKSQAVSNPADHDLFQKLYESSNQARPAQDQKKLDSSMYSLRSNALPISTQNLGQSEKREPLTGSFGPSEGPLRTEDLISKHSGSPHNQWMPVPNKLEVKPSPSHPQECCRRLHRDFESQIRTGRIQLADNKPKKPFLKKSTSPNNASRQDNQLVNELYRSLKEKTQEIEALMNINASLKSQYEHSPPTELTQEESMRREDMEEQLNSVKAELLSLAERNQILELQKKDLEETDQRANDFAKELETIAVDKQKLEVAELFYDRLILRRNFVNLRHSAIFSKKMREYLKEKEYIEDAKRIHVSFRKWRQFCLLRKIIKQKQAVRDSRLMMKTFKEFKKTVESVTKIKARLRVKKEVLKTFCLIQWKRYLITRFHKIQSQHKAAISYDKILEKRVFNGLSNLYKRSKYTSAEERGLLKKYANLYRMNTLRKILNSWKDWHTLEHLPNKFKKQKADAFYERNVLRRMLEQIYRYYIMTRQIKDKVDDMVIAKNKSIRSNFFRIWKNGLMQYISRKDELSMRVRHFMLTHATKKWREAHAKTKLHKQLLKGYDTYRSLSLKKKAFKAFLNNISFIKKTNQAQQTISSRLRKRKLVSSFSKWNLVAKERQDWRQKSILMSISLLKRTLQQWLGYSQARKLQKERRVETEKRIEAESIEIQHKVLQRWRLIAKRSKRNFKVVEALKARRALRICQKVFFQGLLRAVETKRRQQLEELSSKYNILEDNTNEQKGASTEKEAEKDAFSRREQEYNAQIRKLNDEVEEKNLKISNMQKEITEVGKKQKSLVDKLEEQEISERNTKVRSQTSIIEAEKAASDYESIISKLKRENESLNRQLSKADSQQRNQMYDLMEEKAQEHIQQREKDKVEIADVRSKLKNSIKMANEFKVALENKDLQISRLLSSLEEYRRENLSLRADFEALKSTQNKTRKSDIVPKLEGVINNLEKKNHDLRYDLKLMKEGDDHQKQEIQVLKEDIKDYEAEVRPSLAKKGLEIDMENLTSPTSRRNYSTMTPQIRSRSPLRDDQPTARRLESTQRTYKPSSELNEDFERYSQELKRKVNNLQQYITDISTIKPLSDVLSPVSRAPKEPASYRQVGSFDLDTSRTNVNTSPKRALVGQQQQDREIFASIKKRYTNELKANENVLKEIKATNAHAKDSLEERIKRLNESIQDDISKARVRAAEFS